MRFRLQKRFVLRDNARTSAAQVIRLYEKEFAGDSVAPLQSYQVNSYFCFVVTCLIKISKNLRNSV